jgi:hypothetical protein
MSQSREREEMRERMAKEEARKMEERINKLVVESMKGYEGMKELLPETNPKAWKAILFLRSKLRRIRQKWLEKMLDAKIPHAEKDVVLGQYNAVLLFVEVLEQTREIHKGMEPGKEAEFIRSKVFRNPQAQQHQQ